MKLTTPPDDTRPDLIAEVERFAIVTRWATCTDNPNNVSGLIEHGTQLLAHIPQENTTLRERLLSSLRALRIG